MSEIKLKHRTPEEREAYYVLKVVKLTKEIDRLKEQNRIMREALGNALEFLDDLHGEWAWRKDEPRCGYAKAYQELGQTIAMIESITKADQVKGEG